PATGEEVGARFRPNDEAPPSALMFAPNLGRWWAIGLKDGRVLLEYANEPDRILKGRSKAIEAVAFAPDDALLATAGADGFLELWDATKGDSLGTLAEGLGAIHGVAISPSGGLLAAVGADGALRLWNIASRRAVAEVRPNAGALHGVAFTPDG